MLAGVRRKCRQGSASLVKRALAMLAGRRQLSQQFSPATFSSLFPLPGMFSQAADEWGLHLAVKVRWGGPAAAARPPLSRLRPGTSAPRPPRRHPPAPARPPPGLPGTPCWPGSCTCGKHPLQHIRGRGAGAAQVGSGPAQPCRGAAAPVPTALLPTTTRLPATPGAPILSASSCASGPTMARAMATSSRVKPMGV